MDSVIQIWETSLVPIASKPRLNKLLEKKFHIYANLKKSIGRIETGNFKLKPKAFQKSICELFDISTCKCTDFSACVCRKESTNERAEFLLDQPPGRKMYIRPIDKLATKQMEKSLQRKLT